MGFFLDSTSQVNIFTFFVGGGVLIYLLVILSKPILKTKYVLPHLTGSLHVLFPLPEVPFPLGLKLLSAPSPGTSPCGGIV